MVKPQTDSYPSTSCLLIHLCSPSSSCSLAAYLVTPFLAGSHTLPLHSAKTHKINQVSNALTTCLNLPTLFSSVISIFPIPHISITLLAHFLFHIQKLKHVTRQVTKSTDLGWALVVSQQFLYLSLVDSPSHSLLQLFLIFPFCSSP